MLSCHMLSLLSYIKGSDNTDWKYIFNPMYSYKASSGATVFSTVITVCVRSLSSLLSSLNLFLSTFVSVKGVTLDRTM